MIDYSQYSTKDPFRIVNFDLIYESRGIPNLLKDLSSKISNDIINNENNFSKNYDIADISFNVSFDVSILNSKRDDIYATSEFGIFAMGKMKLSCINIYMDISNYNKDDLKRVITHELLHIYEIFNRIKGGSKKDLQWRLGKVLMDIRNNYSSYFIKDFIYLIYLSLDHEINARVAETYSILMELRTTNNNDLNCGLVNTSAWKYSELLKDFDENKYHINYTEFLKFSTELNTLMKEKFKNLNFNIYNIPNSIKDCKKIIKGWKSVFYKKGEYFQSKLNKVIEEVNNDVEMIESAHIEIDDSIIGSGMPYVLKFDKYLERESKINKILNESLSRKDQYLKLCWYDAKVGQVLSESDIHNYIEQLHRNEEDFYDGNLGERISQFSKYKLMEINIDKINIDEWDLDIDYMKDYKKMFIETNDYPPIVLDGDTKYSYGNKFTIIDGTHRVNALDRLKIKTVKAWVGFN